MTTAPGPPDVAPTGAASAGRSRSGRAGSAVKKPPSSVLEVLRLLVVVFFAGAGYQIGSNTGADADVLGSLNGTAVGLVLGSGFGYVLGGVIGRTTATSAEVAQHRLREVSADTLVVRPIRPCFDET